ncbi:MAG: glyoxylate carboligase [Candidatus Accumulibacter sp.]|jgi:tartronate-semialdehyde synthase|nr:glyoxylate carboligase [Accumulibacter sp.]
MPRMRVVDAIVTILEKEGATQTFGVPGAAINPLYSAMKTHGGIDHVLARHVEGASHMADGYTRAAPGNIGVCIGTSGPGGTDMITGLYASWADSVPILCIVGQVPVAKLDKEDFQGVDIVSIATPITKWAKTILEPNQAPEIFQRAFHLMRSGRQGPVLIDLPFDVQMAEIDFDPQAYTPLPPDRPAATPEQVSAILDLILSAKRPLLLIGGGVVIANAENLAVELAEILGIPIASTLMGWGAIPDDHRLAAGLVGIQTAHRAANATFLAADLVVGIGNRWANRHTGDLDTYRAGRKFVHIDIEPTQIGRIFRPDLAVVSDARAALAALLAEAKVRRDGGRAPDYSAWVEETIRNRRTMQRKTHFDDVPLKPQRVYEEMNRAFGGRCRYVTTIGLTQIAGAQFINVLSRRGWINAAQAGPLGWTLPAALGVAKALPGELVVGLSGDYDFEFLIEELAVGAQHHIPYVHIVLNNAYLGLIRQAQRAFGIDYQVQLSFENINSPETGGYGVDHVKVAEGLGCGAIRVRTPEELPAAFARAEQMARDLRVPVMVECIVERITNIAMGGALDNINEFEELAVTAADAPTSVLPMTQ